MMKSAISTRLVSSAIGRQCYGNRNPCHRLRLHDCFSSLSTGGSFLQHTTVNQSSLTRRSRALLSRSHHVVVDNNNKRFFSDSSEEDLGPNPGLASVISQGVTSLEKTASEVEAKTKKALADNRGDDGPEPRQLMEAQRILDVTEECLEEMIKRGTAGLLSVSGEPITILEVQVNRDLKQAKVYWALPYSILLDDRIDGPLYRKLVSAMEKNLLEKGGGKILQRQVHSRLRFYYPPRMKFFPASNSLIHEALSDFVDNDDDM